MNKPLRKLYPESDFFFQGNRKSPVIVYLLHFHAPYHHARHYLGSCLKSRFSVRMREHETGGNGSKLMQAVRKAGITWTVAHVWQADRNFESWIKKHIKNNRVLCPLCHGTMNYEKDVLPEELPF